MRDPLCDQKPLYYIIGKLQTNWRLSEVTDVSSGTRLVRKQSMLELPTSLSGPSIHLRIISRHGGRWWCYVCHRDPRWTHSRLIIWDNANCLGEIALQRNLTLRQSSVSLTHDIYVPIINNVPVIFRGHGAIWRPAFTIGFPPSPRGSVVVGASPEQITLWKNSKLLEMTKASFPNGVQDPYVLLVWESDHWH